MRNQSAMTKRFKFTLRLAAASVIALVPAGASLADPPDMLIVDAPKHRHLLMTPNGDVVRIGPDICANSNLQQAFNQFHYNVHHSALPGIGAIDTLGPQDGAPGLDDDLGAELTALGGCGG